MDYASCNKKGAYSSGNATYASLGYGSSYDTSKVDLFV